MVIRGKMVGVPMFGDCNEKELKNIERLAKAITELQSAIEAVFESEIAEAKIRALGESGLQIANGELPNGVETALRTLCENGVIRNSRRGNAIETERVVRQLRMTQLLN